jgi:hypothetical protein
VAFNGSGTFNRIYNWVTDKSNTVPVTASRMDAEMDGMATGLTTAICRDGQSTATARIPFAAGIGMSDGSVGTPAINFTGDTNSGIYVIGPDNIGVAAAGAKVLDIATTGLTVTGALSASTTLASTGNFAVNTNKFTVAAASGNTVVAGTLGVTGAATLSSTLDVTGLLTISAGLSISGAINNGGAYSFDDSGNGVLLGTLDVTGAVTLASTLSAASVTGSMVAAQAGMETGTSTTTVVTPGRQHFHPSSAKAWAFVTVAGGNPSITTGYNAASVTDHGEGAFTVNFTTSLSSANYMALVSTEDSTTTSFARIVSKGTGGVRVELNRYSDGAAQDASFNVLVFGDI